MPSLIPAKFSSYTVYNVHTYAIDATWEKDIYKILYVCTKHDNLMKVEAYYLCTVDIKQIRSTHCTCYNHRRTWTPSIIYVITDMK